MPDDKPIVLMVDDEALNLRVLVGLLNPHYHTVVAKSGEQALERLTTEPVPDLILLDIMMPGIDGYETCRQIKGLPQTRHVPVIFITAKGEVQDEALGFGAGGVDYITKPFHGDLVLARVRTHIELKQRGDQLERLSHTDALTLIANRRRFDEFLAFEWHRGQRTGRPIALILMDIDHFKLYNDHYGHPAGDGCLRVVGQALTATMKRSIDFVARYGGEEFVCVLSETDLAGARAVAERIRQAVAQLGIAHAHSPTAAFLTLSMGVAVLAPGPGVSPAALVARADQALYAAKRSGRNRLEVAEDAGD